MPVNVCTIASKLNKALIALCEQARQVAETLRTAHGKKIYPLSMSNLQVL